ncbi:MAG: hypothetical protein U0Y82_00660 [Thermoleophilia bacterium]
MVVDAGPNPTPTQIAAATRTANQQAVANLVGEFERHLGKSLLAYTVGGPRGRAPADKARGALFEAFLTLVVLNHWQSTDPARIVEVLRLLYLMLVLAIDGVYRAVRGGTASALERHVLETDAVIGPALAAWDQVEDLAGWPVVQTIEDARAVLAVPPSVHPVAVQLWRFLSALPALRPIGIGDLNIVRAELIGYEATDIADIENTPDGSTVRLTLRDLERSEDVFGQDITSTEATESDTQESNRFSVKTEAENINKSALAVNASVSVQYDQKPVTVSTSGSLGYTTDSTSTSRSGSEFAREVVAKAVSRVERTVATHRRITQTIEHERTEFHQRKSTNGHKSAIYAWLTRRYRGQVYNYGKRLLFETLVREPALGLVDDLLRAHDLDVQLPAPPAALALESTSIGFAAAAIDEPRFRDLCQTYDLSGVAYPPQDVWITLSPNDGSGRFKFETKGDHDQFTSFSFQCAHKFEGYDVVGVRLYGSAIFKTSDLSPAGVDRNSVAVRIDGRLMFDLPGPDTSNKFVYNSTFNPSEPTTLRGDATTLTFEFSDADNVDLVVYLHLRCSDAQLARWRADVYRKVLTEFRRPIDQRNQARQAAYDQAKASYDDEVRRLRATVVNDLLAGASELENRQLVLDALRKRIVATLLSDLGLTVDDADAQSTVVQEWPAFTVTNPGAANATAGFAISTRNFYERVSAVDFHQATLCQFVEQAFDWTNLSFVLYPGYWVTSQRMLETLARRSEADGVFTTFLRSGVARVLVPATPRFETACLYFLATGLPWFGGDAPAIGDPLFVPVDEEIRHQQDDREGATPVGTPWEYRVPTALKYLIGSSTPLPAP